MSLSQQYIKDISIHASAKEATDMILEAANYLDISIHASAKEATTIPLTMV